VKVKTCLSKYSLRPATFCRKDLFGFIYLVIKFCHFLSPGASGSILAHLF
jgi:hypothetical protein